MATTKYKRRSVSLDDTSHDRCKVLADEMSTTVSGLLRILVRNAFDTHQHIAAQQESSRSCLQP
jgi:hypothetical protein